MTLKRLLYFYIAYLILSAAFARKGLTWLTGLIGHPGIRNLSWVLLGGSLLLLILLFRKDRPPWPRILAVTLSFVGIFLFLKGMHKPEERIHIFQYGLLGYLLMATLREKSWKQALLLSLLIVLAVSGADELFQAFLPDRVGDIRDVGFGCLGGTWGIVVASLTLKRGPSRSTG